MANVILCLIIVSIGLVIIATGQKSSEFGSILTRCGVVTTLVAIIFTVICCMAVKSAHEQVEERMNSTYETKEEIEEYSRWLSTAKKDLANYGVWSNYYGSGIEDILQEDK